MANILILSDNDILKQLYSANFEVYLNGHSKYLESYDAISTLVSELGAKSSLFISSKLSSVSITQEDLDFLGNLNKSHNVYILGALENGLDSHGIMILDRPFEMHTVLKKCALDLGIKAKDLIDQDLPKYFKINSKLVKHVSMSPCKVYCRDNEDNFKLICDVGENLSEIFKELSRSENLEDIFIHVNNRVVFVNHVSALLITMLLNEDNLDVEVKNEVLKNGFNLVSEAFSMNKAVTDQILNLGARCSKVMDEITAEIPNLKKLVSLLMSNQENYLYSHTILASYVGNHIIRNVSWGGEVHIEKINYVLFFHDIVLGPIYLKYPHIKYEEDFLFDSSVSEQEKEIVLNHAKLSAELVLSIKKAPIGVDLLIKQHHGMTNGVGFAMDFKDDISPISKVILISEAFVEEFLRKYDENPNYKLKVDDLLPGLKQKFRKSTYHTLIDTLKTIVI